MALRGADASGRASSESPSASESEERERRSVRRVEQRCPARVQSLMVTFPRCRRTER
jgi:hypothetical protein